MPVVGDLLYYPALLGGWKSAKILGQTRTNWMMSDDVKVNKKTMTTGKGRHAIHWYTKDGLNDRMFVGRWAGDVSYEVKRCESADKIRQIAAILGMELK